MKNLVRFDWAIKKILRDKSNFVILEGFLSELLKQEVKIISILESESNKETFDDKSNRVDLLTELESKELVIIEIQNEDEYDYFQRILYGTSKTISENIYMGNSYTNVKKVISISIIYFDLGVGLDYVYHGKTSFVGIHNKDKLLLTDEQKEIFKKSEPEQIFPEYYILKVDKFDQKTKDGLDEWIYFLKTDEIKDSFKAKGLKEAKKKLDFMKLPKEHQRNYKVYLEDLHYRASIAETRKYKLEKAEKQGIKQGIEQGIEQGKKEGIKQGVKQGIKKGKTEAFIESAKSMLKECISTEIISKVTGLTKEQIEKL